MRIHGETGNQLAAGGVQLIDRRRINFQAVARSADTRGNGGKLVGTVGFGDEDVRYRRNPVDIEYCGCRTIGVQQCHRRTGHWLLRRRIEHHTRRINHDDGQSQSRTTPVDLGGEGVVSH